VTVTAVQARRVKRGSRDPLIALADDRSGKRAFFRAAVFVELDERENVSRSTPDLNCNAVASSSGASESRDLGR